MFWRTAERVMRNMGQFALWSILASPRRPEPVIKMRFVMFTVSLQQQALHVPAVVPTLDQRHSLITLSD